MQTAQKKKSSSLRVSGILGELIIGRILLIPSKIAVLKLLGTSGSDKECPLFQIVNTGNRRLYKAFSRRPAFL